MPVSLDVYNKDIVNHIRVINPTTVLDIGAGKGKYFNLIQSINPNIVCDAVEPVQEYVDQFNLKQKYRNVFVNDIIEHVKSDRINKYDLCIMGDVLEHLFLYEAINIIDALSYKSKFLMIIWPTNLPQDHEWESPFEMHKSNFNLQDISRFNVQIYKKTYGFDRYGIPVDMHYALIAGHTTHPNQNIRKLDIRDNIVYGVDNDV